MVWDVLLIAALFLIPGYIGWLAFGTSLVARLSKDVNGVIQKNLTAVEVLYLIIVGGLLTVLWAGMLLAEFGLFSLPLLFSIILGGSVIVGGWAMANGRSLNPFRGALFQPISFLVLPVLALAIWLSPQPFEYINGGRDHGNYINTGINIARTGRILIHDEVLTAVPAQSRPLLINPDVSIASRPVPGPWSEGQRLSGMTIRDLDQGIIAPHAFHLYPVFIAIFAAVGQTEFALMATITLGLFGLISVYVVSARLFNQSVGLLTLFLLTISLAQVWYTKTPSAEILLQPLFWSGMFTFLLMLETQSRYAAFLAAMSFGLMHLTKLDTVFVPLILIFFFLYRWFRYRFQLADWVFIIVYGLLILQSALHAFFIATIYFLDQVTRVLLPDSLAQIVVNAANGYTYPLEILRRLVSQNIIFIIIGFVALGLFLWLASRFQPVISRQLVHIDKFLLRGKEVLAIVIGFSIMGVYLVQSFRPLAQFAEPWQFLMFTSWYLTPLGLLLGVIGLMYIGNLHQKYLSFAWLMFTIHILSFFILGAGTYPDQFWAIRRFIPIVLPALILFAAYVLWDLMPKLRSNWLHALLPLSLIGILVIGQGKNLRPFLGFIDYEGMIDQVAQLDASFPEGAVLLFEKSDAANRVAAPLWFIHNRPVFILEDDAISDPAFTPAIEHWWTEGRDVFWLGNGGVTPPIYGDIAAQYEDERILSVPLVEGAIGRLPQNMGVFLTAFDVHHLISEGLEDRQAIATIWNWQNENALETTGLYSNPPTNDLTPRTWTSGEVVIEFPTSDQLTEIALMMSNGRPPDISPAVVAVHLNDTLLGTVHVNGANEVYNLTLPPQVDLSREISTLRLEMEPWIPAQTGYNADQRELGVYLDWIKLITQEPNE